MFLGKSTTLNRVSISVLVGSFGRKILNFNYATHQKLYSNVKTSFQALADVSTNCTQSINHTCTVNSLTTFSSWIDRNGVTNHYWSGARNASEIGCQCSIDGTCVKASNGQTVCNCDSMTADLVDDGILTDKNALPVKTLRYGGAQTKFSNIKYILGPLVCSGKARM